MNYIEVENQFYILATSSFADNRTIVLKQGDSFGIFDRFGDIHQVGQGTQGLYHEGTRFISRLEFSIEGQRPLILSSHLSQDNNLLTVDLTNPDYKNANGEVTIRGTLHIRRNKFLYSGVCYERITCSNFGMEPHHFSIAFRFNGDFADIFEVRGTPRMRKGIKLNDKISEEGVLLSYKGLDDILRSTLIQLSPPPDELKNNQIHYDLLLSSKEQYNLDLVIAFESDNRLPTIFTYDAALEEVTKYTEQIKTTSADIFTSNEHFNEWLKRSKADLITMITQTENGPYPYAGVPWYSTPFGRDGIITAFEYLWLEPELAKGVLKYLANTQATTNNDFQDAQPGKILHERRGGEMAELGEIPFKLYYGTIDATPLFVVLAGAYFERTGDEETIKEIWQNIENAIQWIDEYGDLDGDGFVEYSTKSSKGLINQGWKDSHDSISYRNGRLAEGPIALCEVQAYVYEAKVRAAEMAVALGLEERAKWWSDEARQLKTKFNDYFWSEEKGTYLLALDGEKKPCEVVSSNAGHCLFSGIATPERARRLGKTLLSEAMFSGWGIRTLSDEEVQYNPMSYHNGSIWPHDNAMISYGFSRYGLKDEVEKILSGTFDTTLFMENQRLPELFCGFKRIKGEGPTAYPVACSPQAWAVGSVFLMVQSCLGLQIKAREKTLSFYRPSLPAFLQEVTVRNLQVNGHSIALQVRRAMNDIMITLLNKDVDYKIEIYN